MSTLASLQASVDQDSLIVAAVFAITANLTLRMLVVDLAGALSLGGLRNVRHNKASNLNAMKLGVAVSLADVNAAVYAPVKILLGRTCLVYRRLVHCGMTSVLLR